MEFALRIESTLEHDGDGLVRFRISGTNADFSATVGTWGQAEDHLGLARALEGFPAASNANFTYSFGSSGTCELEIAGLDALGHLGVWATFTTDWPAANSDRHHTASIFMQCDPTSIDSFVAELLRFVPGSSNQACLSGQGPNNSFKPKPLRGSA